jgi:hypothetical protein
MDSIEARVHRSALRERPPTGWGTCRRAGMRFFSIAPSVLPGTRRRRSEHYILALRHFEVNSPCSASAKSMRPRATRSSSK